MDLSSLAIFVAVAEHGGFSAAAEQLHLTQPAVSKRIAQLETELGMRLLDRLGRQVVPTEAGTLLLQRARHLLAEAAETRRALAALGDGIGGTLRIATSHHIGLHHLPALLKRYAQQFPEVELDIAFVDSEQAYARVLDGRAELAVTTLAPHTQPPLLAQPLWQDPLCFMVACDHPLAARKQVSLADLAAHPAVLPDSGTFTHRLIAALFEQQQLALQVRLHTNYLETIKMLVSVGMAWSALPASLLDEQVIALPVVGARLQRQLGWVRHGGRTLPRAASAFVQVLQQGNAPLQPGV